MNILFVCSRAVTINTSASIRNSAIISGLINLGHNVTLVSESPDKKSEYYDTSLLPEKVKVRYLNNGPLQRIVNWLKRNRFIKPLKKKLSRHNREISIYDSQKWIVKHSDEICFKDYDCIISSSDPKSSHLFVYKGIFNQKVRKWIQIWGDPFAGDVSISNNLNRHKIREEEEKLLSVADDVYYVSESTLEVQKMNYPENAYKMHYVPIPFLKERWFELRDLKRVHPVELCYCGDYPSTYRNIRPLYETVSNMDNVHLTICGASDLQLDDNENVTILPRQGHGKVEEIESKSDILVHISNTSGTQIPGKIYQYSGTNKPILYILDGDKELCLHMFGKYDRYVFADNDRKAIYNNIIEIINSGKTWFPVPDFNKEKVVSSIDLG